MKVFIVLYTSNGTQKMLLLMMRKCYRQEAITLRSWKDGDGISQLYRLNTTNYMRAADLFLSITDEGFEKVVSMGEVLMR